MTEIQLSKLIDILDAHDEKAHREYKAIRDELLRQLTTIRDDKRAAMESKSYDKAVAGHGG